MFADNLLISISHTLLFTFASLGYGNRVSFRSFPTSVKVSFGIIIILFILSLNVFIFHFSMKLYTYITLFLGIFLLFSDTHAITELKNIFSLSYLKKRPRLHFELFIFFIFLFFAIYNNFHESFNCYDDLLAYLFQIKKIVESANLIDPLSTRRLASFGGQQILQAAFVLNSPLEFVRIFEPFFINILILLIINKIFDKPQELISCLLLQLFFITSNQLRINSASQSTSILCLLLVYYIVKSEKNENITDSRISLLCVLALTAYSTFRSSNVLVASILTFYFLFNRSISYKNLGWFFILVPFSWGLWDSSKTPFFPIFPGNLVKDSTFAYKNFFTDRIDFAISANLESFSLIFIIGILGYCAKIKNNDLYKIGFLYLTFLILLSFLTSSSFDSGSSQRYNFPILFLFLIATLKNIEWPKIAQLNNKSDLAKLGLALYFILFIGQQAFLQINEIITNSKYLFIISDEKLVTEKKQKEISLLQDLIPKNDTIYTLVEAPYLFDNRNNFIVSFDILGAALPGGKKFDFSSKDNFLNSLKEFKIKWLIVQKEEACFCQYSSFYIESGIRSKWLIKDQDKIHINPVRASERITPTVINWAHDLYNFRRYLSSKYIFHQNEKYILYKF